MLQYFEDFDPAKGQLVTKASIEPLSIDQGIAFYDLESRVLTINALHPFVAHFLNEYEDNVRSLPLELLAIAEVLLEAHLLQLSTDYDDVEAVLEKRDQLLRYLAKSTSKRNVFLLAQDLIDAASNKEQLEKNLVEAFSSLGFSAVRVGKKGEPDGVATAHLAGKKGEVSTFSVTLEAKSKEDLGKTVSAKTVGVSTIVRHRKKYKCDHSVVVGPRFPFAKGGESALEKEIKNAEDAEPGKTITLMTVADLAMLVKLRPLKRIGLPKLKQLLKSCRMPEDVTAWLNQEEKVKVSKPPYKEILEAIQALHEAEPDTSVRYEKLRTELRHTKEITKLDDNALRLICDAMMQMAGEGFIQAQKASVELYTSPEKILEAISANANAALTGEKEKNESSH